MLPMKGVGNNPCIARSSIRDGGLTIYQSRQSTTLETQPMKNLKADPTTQEMLGRIEERLYQIGHELMEMPIWRQNSRWHLERASERQRLLAERDQYRKLAS
jgi:hypothetical protein